MSAVENLAGVLRNYRQYRNQGSAKGGSHFGIRSLKHLDKYQLVEVADTVLNTRPHENE